MKDSIPERAQTLAWGGYLLRATASGQRRIDSSGRTSLLPKSMYVTEIWTLGAPPEESRPSTRARYHCQDTQRAGQKTRNESYKSSWTREADRMHSTAFARSSLSRTLSTDAVHHHHGEVAETQTYVGIQVSKHACASVYLLDGSECFILMTKKRGIESHSREHCSLLAMAMPAEERVYTHLHTDMYLRVQEAL